MTDHTIFITGIASGVGEKIADLSLAQGHRVFGCDNNAEKIRDFENRHANQDVEVFFCDVSDFSALEAVFQTVCEKAGRIDSLVNNAGMYMGQPLATYDDALIERAIDVNLKAPMKLSLWYADHVRRNGQRGSIVNVASVAGEVGSSDAVYGSVKAGVIGLTKSNAMNYAPEIRVNCVSPGLIEDTDIARAIPDYRYAEYKRQELLDGGLDTDSVAGVVNFLISNNARSMTGAIIRSDNGCYPR